MTMMKNGEESLLTKRTTVGIPGECCKHKIAGKFNYKNGLSVHGFSHTESPGYKGDDVLINEVRFYSQYDCEVVRKLINESASIFLANQHMDTCKSDREDLLQYSHSFRAIIRLAIQDAEKNKYSARNQEKYMDLIRELAVSESIWDFCEIIFLLEPQGGDLVSQLFAWVRRHVPDCQFMLDELLQVDQMEYHEDYWRTVNACALEGRISDAIHLLRASNIKSQACQSMIDCLGRMPVYHASSGQSMMEFKLKWQHWRQGTLQLTQDGAFLTSDNLSLLAEILCGDSETIQHVTADLLHPWYSCLLAEAFYRKPYAALHELQDMMPAVIERYPNTEMHGEILVSALNKNILEVMKQSCEQFTSWWFPAHFSDILHKNGNLREKNSVGTTMRENLILEYASSLMEHESLWSVGAAYFSHCLDYGKYFLQEYLIRISLTTERKAQKVLALCEQNGFGQHALTVCRVMARRAMSEDRLGAALVWCRQAKDSTMATIIAEKFLEKYQKTQTLEYDVLDALGTTMLISKKLLFLAKLREFYQLHSSGQPKQAAELLLNLVTSRMAPKQYWFMLLLELLPLLESAELIFTSDQIYAIMNCLAELKQSKHESLTNETARDRVAALKLALTRSSARATIEEGSTMNPITVDPSHL